MTDKPDMTAPAPAAPAPSNKKATKPAHNGVNLEAWVASFQPQQLAEKLAEELNNRGLTTAAHFRSKEAPQQVVNALQKVLSIEAMKIIALRNEETDNG